MLQHNIVLASVFAYVSDSARSVIRVLFANETATSEATVLDLLAFGSDSSFLTFSPFFDRRSVASHDFVGVGLIGEFGTSVNVGDVDCVNFERGDDVVDAQIDS